MKKIKLQVIILLLSITSLTLYAQQNDSTKVKKYNTWSVSASFGSMLFYGDLRQFDFYPSSNNNIQEWYKVNNDNITERKWGGSFSVNKQITPILGLQGQFLMGKISGIKNKSNKYFEANIYEYGINATISLSNLLVRNIKNKKINVYALAGIGLVDFRTYKRELDTDKFLQDYGYDEDGETKTKMTTETVIPIGCGIKYKINNKLDIGIEATLRNVYTDKLDADVKANTAKDKYGYTSIGITYKFGKNKKSLEWISPLEEETSKELADIGDFEAEKNKKADDNAKAIEDVNRKIESLSDRVGSLNNKIDELSRNYASKPYDVSKEDVSEELDSDADGVPDSRDAEPNTPQGNLVNFQGVTIPVAAAPAIASSVIPPPVAPVPVTIAPVVSSMRSEPVLLSVFFDVNKTSISFLNHEKIASVAKMLKSNPNMKLKLVGNTDKSGSEDYNKMLGKKRAQAVADILINSYGIESNRLSIESKGKSDPFSSTNYHINRRVDFIIE